MSFAPDPSRERMNSGGKSTLETTAPTALSRSSGDAVHPRDFDWARKSIPCQIACPAGTDIPGYLEAVSRRDYAAAFAINLRDNGFVRVLGRICTRPCEQACRHGWATLGESVAICHAKRIAADFRPDPGPSLPGVSRLPASGYSVAVIGGGAAGLMAARTLSGLGHAVTVFDRHSHLGGLLRWGIPTFRLPREILEADLRDILPAEVNIRCDTDIGTDIPFSDIRAQFNAVLLAAGAGRPVFPDVAGIENAPVWHGLHFLDEVNRGRCRTIRGPVVVVGGGFTALDCARVARRFGVEQVAVYYRGLRERVRATPGEVESMREEGVALHCRVRPVDVVGAEGSGYAVRMVRTEDDGTECVDTVPAGSIIFATGQRPDPAWLPPDLRWTGPRPRPMDSVFPIGDYALGSSSLIDAIGHAKRVAAEVDRFLTGRDRCGDLVRIEPGRRTARARSWDELPRERMPETPLSERGLETEVELGLSEEAGVREARRCYLCHYTYEIDMSRCIYCDQCIDAKPRPACIVKASSFQVDGEGRVLGWTAAAESPERRSFVYYIDPAECIRCNACLEVCPTRCISVQKASLQGVCVDGGCTGDPAASSILPG